MEIAHRRTVLELQTNKSTCKYSMIWNVVFEHLWFLLAAMGGLIDEIFWKEPRMGDSEGGIRNWETLLCPVSLWAWTFIPHSLSFFLWIVPEVVALGSGRHRHGNVQTFLNLPKSMGMEGFLQCSVQFHIYYRLENYSFLPLHPDHFKVYI